MRGLELPLSISLFAACQMGSAGRANLRLHHFKQSPVAILLIMYV